MRFSAPAGVSILETRGRSSDSRACINVACHPRYKDLTYISHFSFDQNYMEVLGSGEAGLLQ
jgi:hypothetical protein